MSLDLTTIYHLGRLTRITLHSADETRLLAELQKMVDMLGQLQAVDVSGVLPLAHPHDAFLYLQDDLVTDHEQQCNTLLELAPETQGDYYLVPKVIG